MAKYEKSGIISLARELREAFNTRNPFTLAELMGFPVSFANLNPKVAKANTYRYHSMPSIMINDRFDIPAKTVLCAHELGHALLHNDLINHYDLTTKTKGTSVEYEANLFAVSLLFDDDDFIIPIESMSGYILKLILDYNINPNTISL